MWKSIQIMYFIPLWCLLGIYINTLSVILYKKKLCVNLFIHFQISYQLFVNYFNRVFLVTLKYIF